MKYTLLIIMIILLATGSAYSETGTIRLATTTSTENSGLLDSLIPLFESLYKIKVNVISVGTGKALKLGRNGDVDIVLVHAREAEEKFVSEGHGVNRRSVMHNDFIIVGPSKDPAGLKKAKNIKDALGMLIKSKSTFISRGDDSGTHKKEKLLWKMSDIKPSGDAYKESGQGMGAVLTIADQLDAYTLCDRGTYLAMKDKMKIKILFEKRDSALNNPYGIIAVNPEAHPGVNYMDAMLFIAWITSIKGQNIIKEFTVGDELLFIPDAIK